MATDSRQSYPNHNYVPEYQASGLPFNISGDTISNTPIKIEFPFVTRWVVVHNIVNNSGNHTLRLGFTEAGVKGQENAPPVERNYFDIHAGEQTPRLELRCKELWLMAEPGQTRPYSVIAGLTNVTSSQFPALSGEGIG